MREPEFGVTHHASRVRQRAALAHTRPWAISPSSYGFILPSWPRLAVQ